MAKKIKQQQSNDAYEVRHGAVDGREIAVVVIVEGVPRIRLKLLAFAVVLSRGPFLGRI